LRLKLGDVLARRRDALDGFDEGFVIDGATGDDEAFAQMVQVRLDEGVAGQARGFQDSAEERDGGAFAVGSGDMDGWRQALVWRAELIERAAEALKVKAFAVSEFRAEQRFETPQRRI
jgi:hypothetical protein